MIIETLEIAGLASALTALRLPYGKEVRSDIQVQIENNENSQSDTDKTFITSCYINIDPKDIALMQTLIKRGDEHAKVMRGVVAWAKISAPMDWWSELETYIAGHQRLSSGSKMHTIYQGLEGDALTEARKNTSAMFELTKVDFFSYQCLRNILRQRNNHRLPEWHTLVDWMRTLPFAEELIFVGL